MSKCGECGSMICDLCQYPHGTHSDECHERPFTVLEVYRLLQSHQFNSSDRGMCDTCGATNRHTPQCRYARLIGILGNLPSAKVVIR